MPTPENLATDATVAIMLADGFEDVEALELGLEIVRYLLGDKAVDEVARGVVLAR